MGHNVPSHKERASHAAYADSFNESIAWSLMRVCELLENQQRLDARRIEILEYIAKPDGRTISGTVGRTRGRSVSEGAAE